jgi:3-isopropylmalate dehydrogenase
MCARIAVVAGDGIGPEVIAEGMRLLDRVRELWTLQLDFVAFDWSAETFLRTGIAMPPGAMQELRTSFDAIYVGAFGDPRIPDMRHAAEILLGMRTQLDLYANMRPVRLLDERLCPLKGKGIDDVDFVIVRENTEGAYSGRGAVTNYGADEEAAIEEDVSTRHAVERVIRFAFDLARERRRSLVMADKHNVQRYGGALWHRTFLEVAGEYDDVESRHLFADTLALQLVRTPEAFDVIVTNNLFGDVLSDLAAALQGGLGVTASANIHPARVSLFEPVHGSAPDLAGRGVANPIAAFRTAALMLLHLGETAPAHAVERAVRDAVAAGQVTADLGGTLTTRDAADAVLSHLRR